MARLARIAVHPIKALDPVDCEHVQITPVGGLAGDRVYAIVDSNGGYVNGKRTDAVHRLRADVDLDANRVSLESPGGVPRSFDLDRDRDDLEAWFSEYFGTQVELEAGVGGSLTDSAVYGDGSKTGPTVISQRTLEAVASWFDGIDAEEMRLRLRPNLVLEDVPAFWEDRLVADGGRRFRIGDVTLEALNPVPRCVVPTRDPHTGEVYEGFQETFVEQRDATFPTWGDRDAFDTLFAVMVVARIPEDERDKSLQVGDGVRVVDTAVET